ncbi:MAG: hypothetical protein SFY67_05385 [Candidatus Melainabacteria bacterium]|nr:hypothetical protein [Candidatus Melainabacteria bacterium]
MFEFNYWILPSGNFLKKFCLVLFAMSFSLNKVAGSKELNFSKNSYTIHSGKKDSLIVQPSVDSTVRYKPKPSQKMLDAILCKLVRLRVIDYELNLSGKPLKGEFKTNPIATSTGVVLFDTSETKILREFSEHLRISQDSHSQLLVTSSPTFELTLSDGRKILLGLAGWGHIRWNEWSQDGRLSNAGAFLDWLSKNGINGPSAELKAHQKSELAYDKKTESALADLAQTMPKSMRNFFGVLKPDRTTQLENFSESYAKIPKEDRLRLAKAALKKEFPTDSEQVGALLEWSGKMKTNYSFQKFPVELLLEYSPDLILEKTKKISISSAQWVGICRYYSNLNFRYKYPEGYSPLNKNLQKRIHSEVSKTRKNDSDIEDFDKAVKKWIP